MTKAKGTKPQTKSSKDELPDASLDKVAGGGNQPTAGVESTGSIKTL